MPFAHDSQPKIPQKKKVLESALHLVFKLGLVDDRLQNITENLE